MKELTRFITQVLQKMGLPAGAYTYTLGRGGVAKKFGMCRMKMFPNKIQNQEVRANTSLYTS